MSQSDVKKCPKCGGIMMLGLLSIKERTRLETDLGRRWLRFFAGGWALGKEDLRSDMIVPYHRVDCGYIELYRKLKKKNEGAVSEPHESCSSKKAKKYSNESKTSQNDSRHNITSKPSEKGEKKQHKISRIKKQPLLSISRLSRDANHAKELRISWYSASVLSSLWCTHNWYALSRNNVKGHVAKCVTVCDNCNMIVQQRARQKS